MQTKIDGTHVIFHAAAPIARRPDRAGLPVTTFRQSDGKVRHDGSRAANKQRCYAVAERGRLHGASELDARVRDRGLEHRIVYYRSLEEERRWRESRGKYDRLRRQDKRQHIVLWAVGCFCWTFRCLPHIAVPWCNVWSKIKRLMLFRNYHIAGVLPARARQSRRRCVDVTTHRSQVRPDLAERLYGGRERNVPFRSASGVSSRSHPVSKDTRRACNKAGSVRPRSKRKPRVVSFGRNLWRSQVLSRFLRHPRAWRGRIARRCTQNGNEIQAAAAGARLEHLVRQARHRTSEILAVS